MSKKLYIPLILCLLISVLSSSTSRTYWIVFFGDSITQAVVNESGYITELGKSLSSPGCELMGAGIGGNKVYDLYLRMEEDVLAKKPDLVIIYVGINDV